MTAFGTRKDGRVYPKRGPGRITYPVSARDHFTRKSTPNVAIALAEELKKTQEQVTELENRLRNGDSTISGALDEQNAKVMKIVAEIRKIRQRQGLSPD